MTLRQAKVVGIFLFYEAAATGNTYAMRTLCEMKSFIGFVVRQKFAHGNLLAGTLPFQMYANVVFNPYTTAFPYGNGMVLHFYQQQESSTTKTVHKVINRGLKAYV